MLFEDGRAVIDHVRAITLSPQHTLQDTAAHGVVLGDQDAQLARLRVALIHGFCYRRRRVGPRRAQQVVAQLERHNRLVDAANAAELRHLAHAERFADRGYQNDWCIGYRSTRADAPRRQQSIR